MRLSGGKASRFTRSWAPPQRIVLVSLLGLNATAFIVQLFLTSWNQPFVLEYLGLSDRGINDAYAWQFFTAPLLHNNIWHFAADILVLYFIGRDVEAIIGQRQFLFLYLFGALSGELGHLFLMPSDCVLFAVSGGVAEEIDPLLEKISQRGLASLSRRERRLLEQAREKMLSENAG